MRLKFRKPSPAMIVALLALAVALAGTAYATIPDSNGAIHGCYSNSDGSLRIVDESATCGAAETAIAWNQAGSGSAIPRLTAKNGIIPPGATGFVFQVPSGFRGLLSCTSVDSNTKDITYKTVNGSQTVELIGGFFAGSKAERQLGPGQSLSYTRHTNLGAGTPAFVFPFTSISGWGSSGAVAHVDVAVKIGHDCSISYYSHSLSTFSTG
jgi:hypothetical protein